MTKTKEQIEMEIRELTAKAKALKSELKGEKKSGEKITYSDKDGNVVTAYGTLYYYVDLGNGKTQWKKATSCKVIAE